MQRVSEPDALAHAPRSHTANRILLVYISALHFEAAILFVAMPGMPLAYLPLIELTFSLLYPYSLDVFTNIEQCTHMLKIDLYL